MPYIHPWRALRSTDVLDPIEMNTDFVPAAEKYGGRLNQHDFSQTVRSSLVLASQGYYIPRHVSVSVDPGWRHVLNDFPDAAPANRFRLQNDSSWQVVTSMTLTFNTGVSVLWIMGWLNYCSQTWNTSPFLDRMEPYLWHGLVYLTASKATATRAADVQFAIRVDGAIVDVTRTGAQGEDFLRFAAARPESPVGPGPAPIMEDWAHSMGPPLYPVRMTAAVPVQSGEHTVEIVARRTEKLDRIMARRAEDFINVLSRRLFVLEVPTIPQAGTASSVADVTTYEPEDVFSAASIAANRLNVVRAAYNDVQPGAVARGGFNHFHLPAALIHAGQTSIIPGSDQTSNDVYPGYNTSTVAGAKTNTVGWWPVEDGAGTNLRVLGPGGGAFDTTTRNSFIIVIGNLHVRAIRHILSTDESHNHFGAVAIGYRRSTAVDTIVGESEAHVNSFNPDQLSTVADRNIEADISVFWTLEVSGSLGYNIDYFQLYITQGDADSTATPSATEIVWLRGNLIVLQLRP